MFYLFKGSIRMGVGVVFLLSIVPYGLPMANGQMVLLPDNRIIVGTVTEIAGEQMKVQTADTPRYLSVKQAQEKGIWPLHKGDHLHIVVNEQNMVLGYHPVGDVGAHEIVHGQLMYSDEPLAKAATK